MEGKIGDRKAEIYTYESDNVVYGLSWSVCHPPLGGLSCVPEAHAVAETSHLGGLGIAIVALPS